MIAMWICFGLFFVIYAFKIISLWLALTVWSIGLSIFLLIKNKLPSLKYIIISVILAFLSGISYYGYAHTFMFQMLITGVTCLLAGLAVFSVMEKCGDYQFIKSGKSGAAMISILIGIGAGVVFGIINLLISKGYMEKNFEINFSRIFLSLNPGIHEELSDRAIFMAVFAYLFSKKEQAPTKFQTFSMWFMMTVPHCLSHGYPLFQSMILLVLFSLPFTVLQRKRDIASAMIAHSLVDLMRFVVFGLP